MDASSQRVLEQAPRRKLFLGLQDFFLGHEAIGSAPRLRVEDDVLRCRLSRDRGGGGGGAQRQRKQQHRTETATAAAVKGNDRKPLAYHILYDTIRYDTRHITSIITLFIKANLSLRLDRNIFGIAKKKKKKSSGLRRGASTIRPRWVSGDVKRRDAATMQRR